MAIHTSDPAPAAPVGPFTKTVTKTIKLSAIEFTTTENTVYSHAPTCGCEDADDLERTDQVDSKLDTIIDSIKVLLMQMATRNTTA